MMSRIFSVLAMIFCMTTAPLCARVFTDSISLVYHLTVGDKHLYSLRTDQHIIHDRAIRIMNVLTLEVLSEDELGNYQCKVSLQTDTTRESFDTVVYKPAGDFRFAGYRLHSEVGGYDAVVDALGKVILGQYDSQRGFDQGTITAFARTTDEEIVSRVVTPYTVAFSIPRSPKSMLLEPSIVYRDTLEVTALIQPLTTSSGPTGRSKGARRLVDTLFRATTLDSTVIVGGRKIAFLTTTATKRVINTEIYSIVTHTEREMSTGLVSYIDERCYYQSEDGPRLEYVSVCRLTSAFPFPSISPQNHGTDPD